MWLFASLQRLSCLLHHSPHNHILPRTITIFIMDIHLDHLDSQTRSLVIELLRLDVEEAMTEMAGKEDQFVRDSKAALDTYLADLDAQTVVASDRTMAKSIVRAVHYDEGIIAAAMAQEKQADSDRKAALQLHETGRLPRPTEPSHADDYSGIDDERRFDLEAEYNLRPRDDNEGSDHDYPHRLAKFRSCAICFEKIEFRDLARMPCSHEYCRGCLRELFETVLVDETLYPPRCCAQRIPETEMQIQSFLGGDLLGKFLARKLEMETPNRTYCHRPDCSAFIPPQGIKCDNGTCPKCRSRTCCICKGASHQGSYCPQDESVQDLLRMASEEGWKRCFRCGRMVELSYGCNHICKPSCQNPTP